MPITPAPLARFEPALEFDIHPDAIARLLRLPQVAAARTGRGRSRRVQYVWHDTTDGDLSRSNLALVENQGHWLVQPLLPDDQTSWPAATPTPTLAAGSSLDGVLRLFGLPPSLTLQPIASLIGRQREIDLSLPDGPAVLTILDGRFRGIIYDYPACRLMLAGTQASLSPWALELTQAVALRVPRAGLAQLALSTVRGHAIPPRHLGPISVSAEESMDAAFGQICAHLADVILYFSDGTLGAQSANAVHQMRVAVRRLRTGLSIIKRAGGGAELQALGQSLKQLASRLGAARDWDVFLAGLGNEVRQAFPADQRFADMLAAATRQRAIAYRELADFWASPEWSRLQVELALLPVSRPWREGPPAAREETGPESLDGFAGAALDRRLRHLVAVGPDISTLDPDPLHALRKQAKRLRYSCEFFAKCFPGKATRKYLERLEVLQAAFGAVNDAHVAASLTSQLGRSADRAFAAGAVQGFVAASRRHARAELDRIWQKFYRQSIFWA